MPTPRLPWFKFWIGATTHAKARQLSDGEFRTWIELLDACAQQSVRGRFPNRKAAAAVVRRPAVHIGALIRIGLMDEAPDQSLTMHDWDDWQRWRKEDANDSGSTPDHPPNGHVIDTGSTHDQLLNDTAPLRVEERREKRDVKTLDEETKDERRKPPVPSGHPPAGGRRVTVVDDAFREELENKFFGDFGSREAVRDAMDTAMSHRQAAACTDKRAYLRNWIRGDAEKAAARRRARGVFAVVDSTHSEDCECEQIRADLQVNRNSPRMCSKHGWVSDQSARGVSA